MPVHGTTHSSMAIKENVDFSGFRQLYQTFQGLKNHNYVIEIKEKTRCNFVCFSFYFLFYRK